MGMFCYQCQETARGTGCEFGGVCGKSEELSDLQDLLLYLTKGISNIVSVKNVSSVDIPLINHEVIKSLFMTITNANFDDSAIISQIKKLIQLRDQLMINDFNINNSDDLINNDNQSDFIYHDSAIFEISDDKSMFFKASLVGFIFKDNEDIQSLKSLIIFGLKGMAAYAHHALNLGYEDTSIYDFIYKALNSTIDENVTFDELLNLTIKTGEMGVTVMALLDKANTSRFGNPEITEVNIGTRKNPAILISGHDLTDLEQLLEQTENTGVDVYTHSEMLPAHYYPKFKKYTNFAGNYGNAWHKQDVEFEFFNGPILFTTNCIVPPVNPEITKRIFTTGASGYPGSRHINPDDKGKKDFSEIIALANSLPPPTEIETGKIIGGFAHDQVFALADKIVAAVKSGAIRKFIVMAGCDGRMKEREYYTEFAKKLPNDTVILTAGCAKYRYNKLELGDIDGIPRVLDAGQCNDSYSLALIALKLKEIFELSDINQLPISYNIAWYEQKAVIVLLALLYLGIKNIHLGPTLPAFISPKVRDILINNFGLATIGTVDEDIKLLIQ